MEIQDFGEKIGGAKKDLWKDRGLIIEDLTYMNDAERNNLIKKDNVWKKPNYQKMIEDGLSARVVYFIKMIRDAAPVKPNVYSYDMKEKIKLKQERYIEFVSKLRDFVMNITTEKEVLNFYKDYMDQYIIRTENSRYVNIKESAYGYIDSKLLKASQVHSFWEIDSKIKKKQFGYSDVDKVLSNFRIYTFDNDNIKFKKDHHDRNVLNVREQFGTSFIYPEGKFADTNNWKENTVFIERGGFIIANNLASIDEAKQYILSHYKVETKSKSQTQNRRKNFVPEQLQDITRNGEDYRKDKNITGQDMLDTFNFKGGEFGNWLNENDRQQSLNFGYDALLDLSKALSISPTDISLGNRLSIAFGSRGSGNALAHYEPDREVINLTKMKGAGSLAHEWAHALDDIVGKKLGYGGFATDKYRYGDEISKLMGDLIGAMKYKNVCDEATLNTQKSKYESQIKVIRNIINMDFPKEHLNEEQTELKDKLIQNIIDNAEKAAETFEEYILYGKGNKDIDDLSELRKNTVGKVISKQDREHICHLQNNLRNIKNQIGKPVKQDTDFYKNSLEFDKSYTKTDHGYWGSITEMFARAFACYVQDKLENRSDYLCGHAETSIGVITNEKGETELIKAYPEGEERKNINEKIDKIIEFLKSKEILHNCDYNKEENYIENDNDDYDYNYA